MSRLIDADKLDNFISGPFVQSYKEARDAVREAPTVEAMPLEPLCQWLARYAAPPIYALQEVINGYEIQPNIPIHMVNCYVEAWKLQFMELLKSGVMDTEE